MFRDNEGIEITMSCDSYLIYIGGCSIIFCPLQLKKRRKRRELIGECIYIFRANLWDKNSSELEMIFSTAIDYLVFSLY